LPKGLSVRADLTRRLKHWTKRHAASGWPPRRTMYPAGAWRAFAARQAAHVETLFPPSLPQEDLLAKSAAKFPSIWQLWETVSRGPYETAKAEVG
jgi:hypothetical protein